MRRAAIALFLLAISPCAAMAQDAGIKEVRDAWAACTATLEGGGDDWTGWKRNFDGGYADFFEFFDRSGNPEQNSVLRQTYFIDAIALEVDTSCFRQDGTLAFVLTTLSSPNMAGGSEGPSITREGRLYFGPDGQMIQQLAQITQDGKKVAEIDDEDHQLARGCGALELHMSVDEVMAHMTSELGDIEGNHPAYEVNRYDWCGSEGGE